MRRDLTTGKELFQFVLADVEGATLPAALSFLADVDKSTTISRCVRTLDAPLLTAQERTPRSE